MTAPDLAALSEAYTKSPNALSLTLLGHALVDEYRAGRLVQIDEGVREASARSEAAEARNKVLEEALRRYANVYGVLTDSDREYIAQALGAEHGE